MKWENEKKTIIDENKRLKIEGAKIKAVDIFQKKIKERKLDAKQAKFIEAEKKYFEPDFEKLNEIEKEIDEYLDGCLEDYKEKASIFGVKPKEKEEPKGGGEPGSEEETGEDNPFIPD